METKSSQKSSHKIYKCEYCDYLSYKIGNFNKHLTTPKHLRKQEETKLATFSDNFGNVNKSGEIKSATFFNTINHTDNFLNVKIAREFIKIDLVSGNIKKGVY